jgi:hypothetical protein
LNPLQSMGLRQLHHNYRSSREWFQLVPFVHNSRDLILASRIGESGSPLQSKPSSLYELPSLHPSCPLRALDSRQVHLEWQHAPSTQCLQSCPRPAPRSVGTVLSPMMRTYEFAAEALARHGVKQQHQHRQFCSSRSLLLSRHDSPAGCSQRRRNAPQQNYTDSGIVEGRRDDDPSTQHSTCSGQHKPSTSLQF